MAVLVVVGVEPTSSDTKKVSDQKQNASKEQLFKRDNFYTLRSCQGLIQSAVAAMWLPVRKSVTFFVSGCDSTPFLEASPEVLNEMSMPIGPF